MFELLNYYIQYNRKDDVQRICEEQTKESDDQLLIKSLWIEAFQFFRDITDDAECEKYLI